jgi:hypothetical protein
MSEKVYRTRKGWLKKMEFKDFLKKEEAVVEYETACFPEQYFKSAGSDYFEQPQRVIKTISLGEWAFKKWIEQIEELCKELSCQSEDVWITIKEEINQHSNFGNALGCAEELWCNIAEKRGMEYPAVNFQNTCFEIALTCLGEKEINKRLKELKTGRKASFISFGRNHFVSIKELRSELNRCAELKGMGKKKVLEHLQKWIEKTTQKERSL